MYSVMIPLPVLEADAITVPALFFSWKVAPLPISLPPFQVLLIFSSASLRIITVVPAVFVACMPGLSRFKSTFTLKSMLYVPAGISVPVFTMETVFLSLSAVNLK